MEVVIDRALTVALAVGAGLAVLGVILSWVH